MGQHGKLLTALLNALSFGFVLGFGPGFIFFAFFLLGTETTCNAAAPMKLKIPGFLALGFGVAVLVTIVSHHFYSAYHHKQVDARRDDRRRTRTERVQSLRSSRSRQGSLFSRQILRQHVDHGIFGIGMSGVGVIEFSNFGGPDLDVIEFSKFRRSGLGSSSPCKDFSRQL